MQWQVVIRLGERPATALSGWTHMTPPTPVFLGFRVKQVPACDDWLRAEGKSALNVQEILSISDHVSKAPEGWVERWDWNPACCYNTPSEAWNTVPEGQRGSYELFAYRMFTLEFGKSGIRQIQLADLLSPMEERLPPEPDLSSFQAAGYDVAGPPLSGRIVTAFACSPLSCNGCAADFNVNKHCLIDDWDEAVRAAECFGKTEPEPGPYYIYQVLRKQDSTT